MRLAEQQQVVEALAPDTPEEALAGGVLPRRAVGRAQLADAGRRRDAGESRPVLAVAIADEVAGPLVERGGLAQLLGDSGVRRVARDADVDDPAGAQCADHAGEQRAEEEGGDREAVACPNIRRVVVLEGCPPLPGPARQARLPVGREGRAVRGGRGPGFPPPGPAEQLALPPQERVRLHEVQRRPPGADAAGQAHQQRTLGRGAPRPRDAAVPAGERVAEEGVLGHQRRSAPRPIDEGADREGRDNRARGGQGSPAETLRDGATARDQAVQQTGRPRRLPPS